MGKRVSGVDLGLASAAVVARSLQRLGASARVTLEDSVRELARLVEADLPEERVADCDQCGGIGPIDWGHCCYCGSGDDEVQTRAARAVEVRRHVPFGDSPTAPLDDNVERIRQAKARTATCYWELGNLICENYARKLWRLRTGKNGEAAYSSFLQFCREELGISHSHAYKLMSVAQAFDREEVARFGATKLGVVLQVPEPMRERMMRELEQGASKEQLRELARGQSAETGRWRPANRPRGRAARKVEVPVLGFIGSFAIGLDDDGRASERAGRVETEYRVVPEPASGRMVLMVQRAIVAEAAG
jgi:hypothetical protein